MQRHIRARLAASLALGALAVGLDTAAAAQTIQTAKTAEARSTLPATEHTYNIPSGPLDEALRLWSKQTGWQIIYRADDIRKIVSHGVTGTMNADDALNAILVNTGMILKVDAAGTVAIVPGEGLGQATPDILVVGHADWSLNTGIKRSRDDSQPFVVFTQEDIKRSGVPDLESFLRNQLNANASPSPSSQARGAGADRAASSINLRGLGERETLVLVDGRRQAGVNLGAGDAGQAQITGIPLSAIERIEVLASSASGIYGSGASGGVVNIILRHDYKGLEVTATYADTSDFKAGDGRIDLIGATALEGGRTRVSVNGSWRKTRPLLLRERRNLVADSLGTVLANDPRYFEPPTVTNPPVGRNANFMANDLRPLQLKPEYGGTMLGSAIGTVPTGYRGLALDGIAPLLAGIGRYDLDRPDVASQYGLNTPLVYGSESVAGSLSVQRDFTKSLTLYAEAGGSRYTSRDIYTRGATQVTLLREAPNNPFEQDVLVRLSGDGSRFPVKSTSTQWRALGGAIVKLPYKWQAVTDLSYNASRYRTDTFPADVTIAYLDALGGGEQDVLRDLSLYPLRQRYNTAPFQSYATPGRSSVLTGSLRLAGPLPLSLPGGKPQVTLNLERSHAVAGSTLFLSQNLSDGLDANYVPTRSQDIDSLYGEVAFPIFSENNRIPLARLLELRVSARGERYRGVGGTLFVPCPAPDLSGDLTAGCPPPGAKIVRTTTRNSHVDPSISLRWSPISAVMFRASHSTGYLPPQLSQLMKKEEILNIEQRDPLRGNEPIGVDGQIVGATGGNASVRPESSSTWSAGVILTPWFVPGLRLSADWTRIRKRDNYFSPSKLLYGYDPNDVAGFQAFLKAYPDRVRRGPASDGYSVGKIEYLDVSLANLIGSETSAVDFAADYSRTAFGGKIDARGSATLVRSLLVQSFPGLPYQDYTGVLAQSLVGGGANVGAVRWRANGSVSWTKTRVSVGWQVRFIDGYYLDSERALDPGQGSDRVASQTYHDVFGSLLLDRGFTLRAGINNVFGKTPPLDVRNAPYYYSSYGDPRLTNFYLTVNKAF